MRDFIARTLTWTVRLLLPPTGRHRAQPTPQPSRRTRRPAPASAQPRPTHRSAPPPLCGEDNVLVRPYFVAHEQRTEHQNQRLRRALLACAQLDMAEVH